MIFKGDFIDLLQARLSGGMVTNDTALKYDALQLEAIVGLVFTQILSDNPMMKREMAVPFEITPQVANGIYSAQLPVTPFSNSRGLVWVTGDGEKDWYIIQDGRIGNYVSSILKPDSGRVACYHDGGKLFFTKKPNLTVTAYVIPNVHDMEDDQPLIMQSVEGDFLQMCYNMVMSMNNAPKEILNDGKVDAESK
jgi:hypothetical protein